VTADGALGARNASEARRGARQAGPARSNAEGRALRCAQGHPEIQFKSLRDLNIGPCGVKFAKGEF